MWRSLIMAIGLSLCILGAECMVVDRVVVADTVADSNRYAALDDYSTWSTGLSAPLEISAKRAFVPPEWAPWGLLSGGVMTVLYGSALGRGS